MKRKAKNCISLTFCLVSLGFERRKIFNVDFIYVGAIRNRKVLWVTSKLITVLLKLVTGIAP